MKVRTRLLAMMLAIVMIVSILPVGALAGNAYGHYKHKDLPSEGASAQTQTLIIAASDFQDPATQYSSYDAQQTRIRTIVGKIKAAYPDYTGTYGFFAGGDYEFEETNSTKKVNAGISAVQSAVTDVLGNSVDSVFVQGNHDPKVDAFLSTGGHDTANYGVFVINEDDYESKQSSDTKTKATANLLKTYLAGKVKESYAKPIFVLSHVPLHYSTRTEANGDAQYAKYIYDAIYAYGDELNIIFLYGHDHAWGDDDYLGDSAVYLTPNDTINIATSKNPDKAEPLNFIYMNYGYVGYCWESYYSHEAGWADNTLTMTSFLIDAENGTVTIRRWDENGEHVLKAKGVSCSGSRGVAEVCTPDTTVYTSPQTLVLKSFAPIGDDDTDTDIDTDVDTDIDTEVDEEPVELKDNDFPDITVNACGSSVEIKTADTTATYANIAKYVAYDISVADFVKDTTATVSLPLPTGFDAGKIQVYYRDADGKLEAMPTSVENGVVTFTTTHFSTYLVAEGKEIEVTDWDKVIDPGESSYTYTLDTDGVDSGSSYLIAAGGSDAFLWDNNGVATYSVQVKNNTVVLDTDKYDWTFTKSGDNYLIHNGERYLRINNSNTLVIDTTSSAWVITETAPSDGKYSPHIGNNYIQYNSNGKFVRQNGSSGGAKRLFKLTNTTSSDGETYYLAMTLPNEFTYTTSRFENETALKAELQNQITVYKATDNSGAGAQSVDYTLTGSADPKTAGTYNYTVAYDGHTVGTVKVTIEAKTISGIELNDTEGSVYRGAKENASTGAKLTVNYNDNTHDTVDIILGMLNNDASVVGDYSGLTVTYDGESISGFTLHVLTNPNENDYPEYPQGGSVRVNKTGDGIDWMNTGVAKIELSATGIPVNKGIDVIVMLDTSSSMDYGVIGSSDTRIQALRSSMKELIHTLSEENEDGTPRNVDVAIADFNGYTFIHSDNKLTNNVEGGTSATSQKPNLGRLYTGPNTDDTVANQGLGVLDESAFVSANVVTDAMIDKIEYHSGTNYDYAFDAIYRLGAAKQAANKEAGEDRDLYVVFMTDGSAFQYNYYKTASGYNHETDDWNDWLTGDFSYSATHETTNNSYFNASQYKDFYYPATVDGNVKVQKHWMAEAIKGNRGEFYPVIDPTQALGKEYGENNDYFREVEGLGATMYTIGFCIYDDKITSGTAEERRDKASTGALYSDIIHNITYLASKGEDGNYLYYNADDAGDLTTVFASISGDIKQAATNARFIDTMGSEFDLQMASTVGAEHAGTGRIVNLEDHGITPTIEYKEYKSYKKSDIGKTIGEHKVEADDVGKRYGEPIDTEIITFNPEGTEAYSSKFTGTKKNILIDGVICAENFWYNTSKTDSKTIDPDGKENSGDEFTLAPETFYWNIGTIGETVPTLSYYVYLTDTMEGHRADGFYPTNTSAVLYYTNWLGNEAHKDTVSPILPWGKAKVSYAYYLVDENGKVVVNPTTGETGSFANKIAVSSVMVGDELALNSTGTISVTAVDGNVPDGYDVYDENAAYSVFVGSGDNHSYWHITNSNGKTTTYVTDYYSDEYTNTLGNGENYSNATYDFYDTVVWFAVKYELKTVPDVVVIDYGLPVDINVLKNDMMGVYGTLDSIGKTRPESVDAYTKYTADINKDIFKSTLELTYGSASTTNGKVRYTPAKMQMPDKDVFYYAVKYMNSEMLTNNGYYYADVTVVPATTIYYEDDFVTFSSEWSPVGTKDNTTQDEDRPGNSALPEIDANSVYGSDTHYQNYSTYSNGYAKKATVSASDTTYPTAQFTFTGTGFDIISLTSKQTGGLVVDIYEGTDVTGEFVDSWAVDTFYGYDKVEESGFRKYVWTNDGTAWHVVQSVVETKDTANDETLVSVLPASPETGKKYVMFETNYEWTVTENNDNALYQIPIIKSYDELEYGTYTVVLTAFYNKIFDHVKDGAYDIYFDAVRIYNPAQNNEFANKVYMQDHEGYPQYIEIREKLIDKDTFYDDESKTGAVFIDAYGTSGDVDDYTQFGPNNEVYLQKGQAIAFRVTGIDYSKFDQMHLAAKSVHGGGEITFTNIDPENTDKPKTLRIGLNTATDLYHNVTDYLYWLDEDDGTDKQTGLIIIQNTSATEGTIISLTNLKLTYKEDPNSEADVPANNVMLTMSRADAQLAVKTVFAAYVAANTAKPEPEEPIVEEPEVFEPAKVSVKVTGKNFKVGDTISATITTSSDVASLTLNGIAAKLKKTDKKTGEKTWTVSVKASAVGDMILSVVAYDSEGAASEPIQSTITVTAKNGNGKKAKP